MLPSIIILAVSLSSSLAAVPPRSDDTLHIPIRRRSNVRRQDPGVDRYASAASALRHKYGMEPSPHERRAQTTDIGITNQVCAPSTTDYGVRLTICNPTRARIQVTLPKSTSAHRECGNPLRVSLLHPLTRCVSMLCSEPNPSISSSTPVPQICGSPQPAARVVVRTPRC